MSVLTISLAGVREDGASEHDCAGFGPDTMAFAKSFSCRGTFPTLIPSSMFHNVPVLYTLRVGAVTACCDKYQSVPSLN